MLYIRSGKESNDQQVVDGFTSMGVKTILKKHTTTLCAVKTKTLAYE